MIKENFKETENRIQPNTLDYILALTPIPVLGEIKAAKVARHLVREDLGMECEDDVFRRFAAARKLAYVGSAAIVGAIYTYLQLYQ